MRAPSTDVFALKNSGLDAFLHAEVGVQLDGTALSVLSMLARLDLDPWVQAASWAKQPQADTITAVAGCIGQMPFAAAELACAHRTAARLVRLLPAETNQLWRVAPTRPAAMAWAPIAIICIACAAGLTVDAILSAAPAGGGPAASGAQAVGAQARGAQAGAPKPR